MHEGSQIPTHIYSNYTGNQLQSIPKVRKASRIYSHTNLCVSRFWSVDKWLACNWMTWLHAYLNYSRHRIELSASSSYLSLHRLRTSKHVVFKKKVTVSRVQISQIDWKRKFEENIFKNLHIGDARLVRLLFSCRGIVAFSIRGLHKNSVYSPSFFTISGNPKIHKIRKICSPPWKRCPMVLHKIQVCKSSKNKFKYFKVKCLY